MNTNGWTAFWATTVNASVWAASANPNGVIISVLWLVFAVLIFFTEKRAEKQSRG